MNKKNDVKSYSFENSFLYKLRNKRKLEKQLNLPRYYFNKMEDKFDSNYSHFSKKKNNGSLRTIDNPYDSLKKAHRKLLVYLQRIETPDFLISGKKGKSYINNAEIHKNNNYVLTMDIKNFYLNCKQHHIYLLFKNKFLMADDVATALSSFTTVSNHLPTGSPISQLLAYWTFSEMFEEINLFCIKNNVVFSLYVDDMTFSSNTSFSSNFINTINRIVRKNQLELKKSKLKYYGPNDFKLITGVAVSPGHKLLISNKTRLKIITEYKLYKKSSSQTSSNSTNRLRGLLNAADQVERGMFPRIKRSILNISENTKQQ